MATPDKIKRYRERLKQRRMAEPTIECACGCGARIPPYTIDRKPAKFAHGHNSRPEDAPSRATLFRKGHQTWNKGSPYPRAREVHLGKKLTTDEIQRRKQTRLDRNNGVYQLARGWKHSAEFCERIRQANIRRELFGERNPFFGKKHKPESRARMGQRGPENHSWRGGIGRLPYGPEFTNKTKKAIRERDNYTCQRCGITQEQVGRTLHVHHIDHDKSNNDWSNLVTTCCRCNIWFSNHRDEPFQRAS